MSIATVQRQLAASSGGDVNLRRYLTQLCESLSASMIMDQDKFSIVATIDDSNVEAHQSLSVGLIVTELVINALKHAFSDQPAGTITVDYRSNGDDWVLSVTDDGVGMPKGRDSPKVGLGTGIVEALAKNLRSVIVVRDANPGTIITVTHRRADEDKIALQPAA